MKKFSWIFALILALSIGFIGCPEETTGTTGGGTTTGGGGYDGPVLKIKFAESGEGTTQVKKDGMTGDPLAAYDPGTLTYVAEGDGYKYAIAPGGNYGNGIMRFMVDLGETALGDYQAVSFDFQAEGYFDDSDPLVKDKKIFLLASKTESDVSPYKNDSVPGEVGKSIAPLIISTDYFDNTPHTGVPSEDNPDKLYAAALQPTLNGIQKVRVTLPIVKSKTFMGETWFAIYLHAGSGAYTITNFQFGADPTASTTRGPDAPSKPLPSGEPNAWFYLDLSTVTTVTGPVEGVPTAVTPVWNATNKTLTASFTGAGRLNVDLKAEQLAAIKARSPVSTDATDSGNNINVSVKGRIVTAPADGEDKFRYSIGDASLGSNWATWHAVGSNSAFASIMGFTHWVNYANQGADPKHFILNYQGSGNVTVEITSIRIEFENGAEGGGEIASSSATKGYYEVTFDHTTTPSPVTGHNATVAIETDDSGYTIDTTEGYDWAWAYFQVTFPTGYKLSDYTYIDFKGTVLDPVAGTAADADVTGYKPIYFYAYETEAAIPTDTGIPDADRITTGAASAIKNKDTPVDNTRAIDGPSEVDGNSVFIVIRTHGAKGIRYKITDIKFY
jgi:hypothetical protein